MTEQPLSSIKRVDLRNVWPNEAADFTPWLAENISALGDALGMDLALQEKEAAVGGYALDILATDVNGNRPVIIENQLEVTDHDHLGKLLTYAAGFDANVVVWLTREFRDEHRQALDWLNQRTGEGTAFFGVVVELWQIDGSRPAPHFNLVAAPNDWRKESVSKAATRGPSPSSERDERYRQFFQELIDTLREEHRFTGARKGQPQSWYSFSAGYGQKVTYGASFTGDKQARTEVYIDAHDADSNLKILRNLEEYKAQIESELGQPLEWQPLENRRACRIEALMAGSIDDDEETLSKIHDWMVANLLGFKKVFGPHLKRELALS
jgi:hypothetical protein